MQPIHIFKAGKHRPANGDKALQFSESELQAAAEAYDPAVHEAPIVIGHPSEDAPAYGWIESLAYSDGNLHAEPRQVADEFAELVKEGRYKTRSASFYRPDSERNPVPGTYYLRHVGFLGATPPAVKGLDPIKFTEPDDDVVEFTDPQFTASIVARMFRSMRDAWIERFGLEAADKVLPEFSIEDLEAEARISNDSDSTPAPVFSEPGSTKPDSEGDMKPEELQAKQDELAERERKIQEQEEAVKAEQAKFAERAAQARHDQAVEFADKLIEAKKLLPAHKDAVVSLLDSVDSDEASVQFAEGEDKVAPREALKKLLEAQPERVDFTEKSADNGEDPSDTVSAAEIANKALKFKEEQEAEGRHITITQATREVTQQIAGAA